MKTIEALTSTFPRSGRLEAIVARTEKRRDATCVDAARLRTDRGIEGDHRAARPGSRRQVTLIQAEHLPVIAALCGLEAVPAQWLRRNLVVSGINLLALRDRRFRVGDAVLEGTGACHPCSRMETILGPGGYNAMRGHGGITAIVIGDGIVRIGEQVTAVQLVQSPAVS